VAEVTSIQHINRFLIKHRACNGEVTFAQPTEADFMMEAEPAMRMLGRCCGCGAVIRELVPLYEVFRNLRKMASALDVKVTNLLAAITESNTTR